MKCSQVHSYSTRLALRGDLFLERKNTFQYGIRSIEYNGARLWNMIPSHIREAPLPQFLKIILKNIFSLNTIQHKIVPFLNKGVPAAITPETDQNGLSSGQFLEEYASTCGISFFLLLKFVIFFLLCEAAL